MSPKNCLGAAKGFLFLINLLCSGVGILLLIFSLWGLFSPQSFASLLGSPLFSLRVCSYVFAGLGGGALILGVPGCWGALKGVKFLLLLYFGGLLLLFAAQMAGGVVVYTQRWSLSRSLASWAQEQIGGYPPHGPPAPPHQLWDALQHQLGCCGWNGPQDWGAPGAPPGGGAIACSCLISPPPPPGNDTSRPTALPHGRCPTAGPHDVFPGGCAGGARAWLEENLVAIVGGGLGIGLLELSLLMVAMFLIRNLSPAPSRKLL